MSISRPVTAATSNLTQILIPSVDTATHQGTFENYSVPFSAGATDTADVVSTGAALFSPFESTTPRQNAPVVDRSMSVVGYR